MIAVLFDFKICLFTCIILLLHRNESYIVARIIARITYATHEVNYVNVSHSLINPSSVQL